MNKHGIAGLTWMLLSISISLLWGLAIGRGIPGGMMDFQAVYYAAGCLEHHCDPYQEKQLEAYYRVNAGFDANQTPLHLRAITQFVNTPATLLVVAPFALLPWKVASVLWLMAELLSLGTAALLIWNVGSRHAPTVATFLLCILLVNCELMIATGNTAGLVVGLTAVGVYCILHEETPLLGVICLALGLVIKPHDAWLVWLCLLLAGAGCRKRAVQSAAIALALVIPAMLWMTAIVPNWIQESQSRLASFTRGGFNDPGPSSFTSKTAGMVIDLQGALSLFRDDPHFYNPVAYAVCGLLLVVWLVIHWRSKATITRTWFAMAFAAPLTMLVTYHRPHDAKLLLLTVPACAILWMESGKLAWAAVTVTAVAIALSCDIPLSIFVLLSNLMHIDALRGWGGTVVAVVFMRPASLVLLAAALFYLGVFWKRYGNVPVPALARAAGWRR